MYRVRKKFSIQKSDSCFARRIKWNRNITIRNRTWKFWMIYTWCILEQIQYIKKILIYSRAMVNKFLGNET